MTRRWIRQGCIIISLVPQWFGHGHEHSGHISERAQRRVSRPVGSTARKGAGGGETDQRPGEVVCVDQNRPEVPIVTWPKQRETAVRRSAWRRCKTEAQGQVP